MIMTIFSILFYLLAILLLVSTGLAVTRSHLVHTVVFLVMSFLATALLFYLLGAPFLAALEVIIYAGAIMVMFLFIIMTLKLEEDAKKRRPTFGDWLPAVILGGISLVLLVALLWAGPDHGVSMKPAMASPMQFGVFIFHKLWFPVEVASFLLFVALAGALYLGRNRIAGKRTTDSEPEGL